MTTSRSLSYSLAMMLLLVACSDGRSSSTVTGLETHELDHEPLDCTETSLESLGLADTSAQLGFSAQELVDAMTASFTGDGNLPGAVGLTLPADIHIEVNVARRQALVARNR